MEFIHPLLHNRCWTNHDNRTIQQARIVQGSQKPNNLNRFAETHFVANDAANFLRIQLPEPLDTRLLIVKQRWVHISWNLELCSKIVKYSIFSTWMRLLPFRD